MIMKNVVHNYSKVFNEVEKKLSDIDNNISKILESNKQNSSSILKKLNAIAKDVENIYKILFDEKTFNEDFFDYFTERKIFRLLVSYLSLQEVDIIKVILPFVHKILFESDKILKQINHNEEILLMNTYVNSSIKILIHSFLWVLKTQNEENFLELIVNFLFNLLHKLILYPHFYYAISSSNDVSNLNPNNPDNFDSGLFELIVDLFTKESKITKRESKAKLRKTILLCLNLENFYNIKIEDMEKLLNCLVENLLTYYENFNRFEATQFMKDKKELVAIFKKEKINEDELYDLIKSDLISYLKFFSMVLHCFSQSELKKYLSNLLFNKFFNENVQNDILNSYLMNDATKKIYRIFDFLYLLSNYVKNKTINDIFFFFFFGFSLKEEDFNEVEGFSIDDEIYGDINPTEDVIRPEKRSMTVQEIGIRIEKLINKNKKNWDISSYEIDKSSHRFEKILSFLITVIESNSENFMEIKIIFFNILYNIVKNSSNLFLTEIIVPYYLYSINLESPEKFHKLYDKLRNSRDKILLVEVLKNIHPKYFNLDMNNWMEYFNENIEKNFDRNIFMLENIDSFEEVTDKSDSMLTNEGNMFLDCSIIESIKKTGSNSMRGVHDSEDLGFNYSNSQRAPIIETEPFDSINMKDNMNNSTINIRVNFFSVLINRFKKFPINKYKENLFLTKLFLEIYSLPYLIHMGEQGQGIYNIYSNITYSTKRSYPLFKFGSVGTIFSISFKLDELVRLNFTREEISKFIELRKKEKDAYEKEQVKLSTKILSTKIKSTNAMNKSSVDNDSAEFLDNLILFNEFFKEYAANIFTKCYFDQTNANYTNAFYSKNYFN